MSDLQLGLLIIGLVVLVAVIAYNKWQENRLRRKTESAFAAMHEDVLLGGTSTAREAAPAVEDELSVPEMSGTRSVEHTLGEVDEQSLLEEEPSAEESAIPPAEPVIELPYAQLNSALDCIATLECPTPVRGHTVAAHAYNLFDDEVARQVLWEGWDEANETWAAVQSGEQYGRIRAGLQLATHTGLVPQHEVESFSSSMVELALALAADVNVIDIDAVRRQMAQLEAFLGEFDVQVGLSVVTADERRTIPGTKIRGIAESAGFVLERDGRYHRYDEEGLELYMLANMEPMPFHPETLRTFTTRGVTLLLNVPRAPGVPATFRNYIKFARQLAEALNGSLVDDNQQPIGDRAIEQVGTQLNAIHEAMAAGGIPAGSDAARRLFA